MKKTKECSVIFCSFGEEVTASRLKRVIEIHFPKDMIIYLKTMDDFISRIKKPLSGNPVLILLCATKDELSRIILLRDLLMRHRIILILPDSEPGTLSLGHMLRPRFTTFIDEDMIEVSAVLVKMFNGYHPNKQSGLFTSTGHTVN